MSPMSSSATGPNSGQEIVTYDFDRKADVLYIGVGTPGPSICREVPGVDGLHLHHALADDKVVGATIVWYSQQERASLQRAIPFPVTLP